MKKVERSQRNLRVWSSDWKILCEDVSGNKNLFFMINQNLGGNG